MLSGQDAVKIDDGTENVMSPGDFFYATHGQRALRRRILLSPRALRKAGAGLRSPGGPAPNQMREREATVPSRKRGTARSRGR
jgi:hypothetical protein